MIRATTLFCALTGFVATAAASPGVEFVPGADFVIVRVHGASAGGTPRPTGDRIVLELKSAPASQHMTIQDETVKQIDLSGNTVRIGLHHSKRSTERSAAQTRLVNAAGTLTIEIPRHPKDSIESVTATETAAAATTTTTKPTSPTASTATAPTASTTTTAAAPAPTATAPTTAPAPTAAATTATAPTTAPAITAATPTPPAALPPLGIPEQGKADNQNAPLPAIGAPSTQPPYGRLGMFFIVLGGLAAVALLRRKGTLLRASEKRDPIRVIATRSLGGKSKLVLVEAQGRELLMAVHDNKTELLSGWTPDYNKLAMNDDPSASAPTLPALKTPVIAFDSVTTPTTTMAMPADEEPAAAASQPTSASPAVAGLMRLRRRRNTSHAPVPAADDRAAAASGPALAAFHDRLQSAIGRRGVK